MNTLKHVVLLPAILLSGCVSMNFLAVAPGAVAVGDIALSPSTTWNEAPAVMRPYSRRGAEVWTRDGLLLDRVMIIPGVPDGETLFDIQDPGTALPTFRPDMLPNELEEFTESSLVTLFGEGNVAVNTSGLRPHRFGETPGVLFNFDASLVDSPDYKGLVGAFIANGLLYMMLYVAAEPYYYDKHLGEASVIIETATLM
jgi:hypothetical protein